MIFYYSFIHLFFALMAILAWFAIDRKRDYKRYFKLSLLIGIPLGILIDFGGSAIFGFWSYKSMNLLEYIAILLCTYVVATPFLIETTQYIFEKLKSIKFKGINEFGSNFYYTEFFASLVGIMLLSIYRLTNILNAEDLPFFIILLLLLTFFSDGLLGIYREEGVVTQFLKGYYLIPVGLLLAGLIMGIPWEFLNVNLRLWTYDNLPLAHVLNIPIVVLLHWCTLNLVYWTTAKVVSKFVRV